MSKTDITVILTSGCTMSCKYCFEHQRDHLKDDTMSGDTLIQIFEKYYNIGTPFDFHLFGGEPTLNKEALKQFVEYLESYKEFNTCFFMDIQTNLYRMDEEIYELFRRFSVVVPRGFGICVSIDGVSTESNSNRIDHDGINTFDIVRDNLIKLKENVPSVIVDTHSVITNENAPHFTELVFTLKEWYDHGIIDNFGMNWLDADTVGMSISEESIESVMDQYWNNIQPILIKENYTEEMQSCFMVMGLDLYLNHEDDNVNDTYNICGAGVKTVAYLPSGEEIPCHKYMDKRAKLIDYDRNNYPPKMINMIGEDGFRCIECPLRFICQTCIASNELYGGYLNQKSINHCKRWRYIIKSALHHKLKWAKEMKLLVLNEQHALSDELIRSSVVLIDSIIKNE